VYDCFRAGRRRVDDRLVGAIVRALGRSEREAAHWRDLAQTLNGERNAVHLEVVRGRRAPADVGEIVGREQIVRAASDAEVVVLSGLPGVGKTTLATALAVGSPTLTVELRESEPGRPIVGPVEVLRRMLSALGHRSLPYDLARLRERFATDARGITIVIEDAVSPSRLAALLVPGIRFIVTSRVDLTSLTHHPSLRGRRLTHVTVPPLDGPAAHTLLSRLIADEEVDASAASRRTAAAGSPHRADALTRIVAVAGGLPLDIVMIAGVMREHAGWTLDDMASRFESEPRDRRIRPVLEVSGATLEAEDVITLTDAALIDREFDTSVLIDARGPEGEASLKRLRARHLVDLHDGRLVMHATVFAFARERAMTMRPRSERRAAIRRMADVLLTRIAGDEDYAAREVGTVLAVAEAAHEHALDEQNERLALASYPALARWSLWTESLRLHDLAAQGRGLELIPELALNVAHCAERLGRYDEALHTLHRVRRIAGGTALARTWNQIGNVQHWMCHLDESLTSFQRAVEIATASGDHVVQGRALGNHANALRVLTRFREAEQEFSDALEIATGADDQLNMGIVRANRALLWTSTGRLDDAEAELQSILDEAGERAVLYVRMSLGLVAEARGDFASAAERLASATMAMAGSVEYSAAAELALLGARLDARAGRFAQAVEVAREALRDADRAGTPLIATEARNSLAEIIISGATAQALEPSLMGEAESHASEATSIAEAVGDRAEIARGMAVLGRIAGLRGDVDTSETLAERARSIYREIGHRLGG
jgi:tetratricopeptide (TPR) repeat protein